MNYRSLQKRVSDIIEVGYDEDFQGRAYDVLNLSTIVINLTVSVMMTFDGAVARFGSLLSTIEIITIAFFTLDYILRLWTAPCLYPGMSRPLAVLRYTFSFNGLVDMLSCIPFYLPFFFPSGLAAFRILRVVRIFRLFRINAYFDSLNVITAVLKSKAKLLASSVFVVLLLMLASSLCMYSIEHSVQPTVFDNALSGLWWAAATLLTVGYGDIYPITPLGKLMGTLITMLGVGIVAIPTGIISAGFVEQYSKLKKLSEQAAETDMSFIQVILEKDDEWTGMKIHRIMLPKGVLIAAVLKAGNKVTVPRGDVLLEAGDVLILGARRYSGIGNIELKEIELKAHHDWNNQKIRDLDISRQTFIVMIRRNGHTIVPNGDTILQKGDHIVIYGKESETRLL
ncbi:MAG: ion transporter [Lachnospiraceae bacterium]|nr:ion transporter [Lachnospiraceae bacterium]